MNQMEKKIIINQADAITIRNILENNKYEIDSIIQVIDDQI